MAGTLIVSNLTTDTDNTFIVRSNTGTTLFSANTSGIDIANSIGATAITNDKILSVANTKISGLVTASQIANVANTQITGNIISSQITSIGGSQITANTIANSAIQTGAVENYMNSQNLGFSMRNRIINGAMVIDQRNAGASISVGSSPVYAVDRFESRVAQGSGHTGQRVSTAPVGFSNSLKITIGTGASPTTGQNTFINQQIEGFNFADLGWGTANAQTITVFFRVYSSLTGTFAYSISNDGLNRSYVATYSIPVANTWTTISLTIPGDTSGTWIGATNGIGCFNFWDLGSGSDRTGTAGAWTANWITRTSATVNVAGTSSATFYITGVQLEKGSTATSFDYRHFTTELQLCQRYYQQSYDIGTAAGTVTYAGNIGWGAVNAGNGEFFQVRYPVFMRAVPTITTYNPVTGASGSVRNTTGSANVTAAINGGGMGGFSNLNAGLTTGSSYLAHYTASAEL